MSAPQGWIRRPVARPDAAARVLCVPHAGAGASAYRAWPRLADERLEVLLVQPPGRGDRADEPSCERVGDLVTGLRGELDAWLDRPLALFGNSFGAWVSFELARVLEGEGWAVALLVVAGAGAPHMGTEMGELAALDDAALVAELSARGALPAQLVKMQEMLELVLPPIRADLGALARYRFVDGPRLSCPVRGLVGDGDRDTPVSSMREWSAVTTGDVSTRCFPGGHLFVGYQSADVLADIEEAVLSAASARVG